MSVRKMIALAAVLLGLLLYIFQYELPKEKETEAAQQLFRDLKEAQVKSIEIDKGTRIVMLMNRGSGNWELSSRPGVPLEAATVDAVVSPLLALKLDGAIPKEEEEADRNVYGLGSPEMTMKVVHDRGETQISLGKKNDFVLKRYLSVAGNERIYLIPDSLFSAADKTEKDFRKKNVVAFSDFDVKKFSVQKDTDKVTGERGEGGEWKLVEPVAATGSREKIADLLRELRDLKADEFIDFAGSDREALLKEHHLDTPELTATLELKSGASIVLKARDVADANDPEKVHTEFSAANLPFIGIVNTPVLGRIAIGPDDLRERRLFSVGGDVIRKAEIERPGQPTLTLELVKDTWKLGARDADQAFVQQFFKDAQDLLAVAFPLSGVSEDYGFASPTLKITFWTVPYGSDEKPSPKTLVIGKETPQAYYAAAGDLHEPFMIAKDSLKSISPTEEALAPVEKHD